MFNRSTTRCNRCAARIFLTCAIAVLTCALTPSGISAAELTPAETSFLKTAAENGMAEIALAKLALEKTSRPDIKMFARQLLTDHTKANNNLKELAASKAVKLPAGPGVKNDAVKARLQMLSGRDFDDGYVNTMVDNHKSDIAEFNKESDDASDSDVRKFASITLPILREHLNMVKAIQGKMAPPRTVDLPNRSPKNVHVSVNGGSALYQRAAALIRSHPFAWFALAAACWTLFLYRHAMGGGFVYDDFPQIRDNPALLSWHRVLNYFRSAVPFSSDYLTTGGSFYRPLLWVSLALDRQLWALDTAAFHATNLALHFLNSLLLFLILRRTRRSIWVCTGTCLVWLALPINTEAVAWISGRYIELFALFVLLGLWTADIYAESRRNLILACYLLSGLGAMLSYEAGVLLFPLTAIWLYFRGEHPRIVWLRLGVASALVCFVGLILRSAAGAHLPEGSVRMFAAGTSFFKYLAWIVAPIHMSIERSTDLAADRFSVTSALATAVLALLVATTIYLRRKLPDVALGLAWLLITLLPFCGIVPNYQGMAERYLYLPSIGVAFLLVTLSSWLKRSPRSWYVSVVAVWMFWGAWRLNARVIDWRNEIALDLASLRATPRSPILLYNLGVAKAQAGDAQGAIDYYRKAIAANPKYGSALLNLASLLRAQGKLTEALAICQRAAKADPMNRGIWMNLGNIYGQLGSIEQAKNCYERAVALDPRNAEAVINLGTAYQRLGNLDAARQQYEFAISLNPSQAAAYCDLGALLFQQGDTERAVHVLNKAIEIDPSYPTAYFDLGVLYQQRQMYVLAREMYGKVLELDPHHQAAQRNLERIRQKGE